MSQSNIPVTMPQRGAAQLEDERIWTRHWACVGVEQQIPDAGDLLPATVGAHGLHVQRQPDGDLRAAFNVLQYGSCWTIPAQCGNGHKTRCPYVSCAHSLDTDALAAQDGTPTPEMRQFIGFNSLKVWPVPFARLGPFIFVCLQFEDPPPFGDELGGIPAAIEESGLDRLAYIGRFWVELDCHWALAGDALFAVLGASGPDRLSGELTALDKLVTPPELTLLPAFGELEGRPASRAYRGFPNVMMAVFPNHVAGIVAKPTRLDGVALVVHLFTAPVPGQTTQHEDATKALVESWKRVCAEARLLSPNLGGAGSLSPILQRARRLLDGPSPGLLKEKGG